MAADTCQLWDSASDEPGFAVISPICCYTPHMDYDEATFSCGYCKHVVYAKVVFGDLRGGGPVALQCPACQEVSVRSTTAEIHPPQFVGSTVKHLPDDVDLAWTEALISFKNYACTPAEMMCRKILMHIAVDVGVSKPGQTFVGYVEDLDKAGYFAPGLKAKVTAIKDRGNAANHELPASEQAEARVTMNVTEHLLRTVYELPNS